MVNIFTRNKSNDTTMFRVFHENSMNFSLSINYENDFVFHEMIEMLENLQRQSIEWLSLNVKEGSKEGRWITTTEAAVTIYYINNSILAISLVPVPIAIRLRLYSYLGP